MIVQRPATPKHRSPQSLPPPDVQPHRRRAMNRPNDRLIAAHEDGPTVRDAAK
jgi:hypothetical protein